MNRDGIHPLPRTFAFQRDYYSGEVLEPRNRELPGKGPRLNIRLMAAGFSATFAFEREPAVELGRMYEPWLSRLSVDGRAARNVRNINVACPRCFNTSTWADLENFRD